MIASGSHGTSANTGDYRATFIRHVHELLHLGYRRIDPKSQAAEQETSITGELVREMREVVDDDGSPRWACHFDVHEDPPVNDGKRKGKRRKRIDIEVVSSKPRPRNHFSFEAKRLGEKSPLADYLGPDGLGCFLRGDYAAKEDEAGMLGYVQSRSEHEWADDLESRFKERPDAHDLCGDGPWQENRFKNGPAHTYRTRHRRPSLGRSIDIFHTLLLFH